jgi:hypothetical protein
MRDAKTGIVVPGGIVTIDPYRGRNSIIFWTKIALEDPLGAVGAIAIKRDIVIQDATRENELYRDGPYNSIAVSRPLKLLLTEIREVGLEVFL